MKKDNKTNAILNRYFSDYRDSYVIARMAIIDLVSRGLSFEFPSDDEIKADVAKRHADDGKEVIDENGHKRFKFSFLSADLEVDMLLCEKEIAEKHARQEITASDLFACFNEFYK